MKKKNLIPDTKNAAPPNQTVQVKPSQALDMIIREFNAFQQKLYVIRDAVAATEAHNDELRKKQEAK